MGAFLDLTWLSPMSPKAMNEKRESEPRDLGDVKSVVRPLSPSWYQ